MRNAQELLTHYAAYHRDRRNIASHFIGIPMIVLAVAVLLSLLVSVTVIPALAGRLLGKNPNSTRALRVPLIDAGARVFKSHIQVGEYDPRDPLLDPVWGALSEAQVPSPVTWLGSEPPAEGDAAGSEDSE